VVDGDTIRLDGIKPDIRLVGFNAPETDRARCAEERALADVAYRRLRELVSSAPLQTEISVLLREARHSRP
jgi:endonuclease YncB( thermonuclease family)